MHKPSSYLWVSLVVMLSLATAAVAGSDVDPLRLEHNVVPTSQSIQLEVDADKGNYAGSVHIVLGVREATNTFRFHAKDMTLESLVLSSKGTKIKTTHSIGEHGLVTVTTATPLTAGEYGLDVTFSNEFNRQAHSLYKVETEGDAYTFTQFEAEYAREAFPCWDEPIFKIPFQMTLVVPRGHKAISNTPIEEETVDGHTKTVVFEKTQPLPSYLLAVATGPFETVPMPGMSVPGNIITVRGQSHLAKDAVEATPRILAALEDYFDGKYPYKKLDVLAVPEFLFGAMENVGAVTFRDDLLLMDSEKASVNQRRFMTVIMAHELAHMWFGNMVTTKWWDDIWLNEAFATWMGYKATDVAYPQYQFGLEDVNSRRGAMRTDALPSARPIRHPFAAGADPMQLFDELTYQKGQAVLSMIEQWLGESAFRKGMKQYMKKHRWGNATADDLWQALSGAADIEVGAAMGTFVQQAGVPMVRADVLQKGLIRLSQRRFENYGVPSDALRSWQIPVTLRYFDGDETYTQKVLMTSAEQTVELRTAKPVVWIHPNASEKGYYRWDVPVQVLEELAARATEVLTLRERMAFVDNLSALLDAGRLGGEEYLRAVARFADDPAPEVASSVVDAIVKVHKEFITEEIEDDFALYVRNTLRPVLDRIGLSKADTEVGAVSRLRPRLVWWLGAVGQDEEIKTHALELAKKYEKDPMSVDPSMVLYVLELAARYGDRERFEHFKKRFEDAETPRERRNYLAAIGAFMDPEIVDAALEYTLGTSVRPNESFRIPVAVSEEFRERTIKWAMANYGRVSEKVPTLHLSFMMPALADGTSEKLLAKVQRFLSESSRTTPLMEKNLKKAADRVTRRARVREKEGQAVAAYLGNLAKGG